MKINSKILSIPPYISTAWKNVISLHIENQNSNLILIVSLINGTHVEIAGMDIGIIKTAFSAHASFIEQESSDQQLTLSKNLLPLEQAFSIGLPLKSFLSEADNTTPLLQHNAEQSDSPDLPAELLQKISALAKTLGIKDSSLIPQAEPHCNCIHCQISKAMLSGLEQRSTVDEEIVSDEDLKFRTWDIAKTGDKLYSVTNPLESEEHYSVFLGDPVGCTCGKLHCEHIRAVLNS